MLRIWKGNEVEGFEQGKETLFICSDTSIDSNLIKSQIIKHNIKRIYLGAGRQRFKGFGNYKNDKLFVQYCIEHEIQLIIETEPQYLSDLLYFMDYAEIIVSIRTKSIKLADIKNIKLKIDDYKIARIFNNIDYMDTCLDTVKDNLYADLDEVVYEEV